MSSQQFLFLVLSLLPGVLLRVGVSEGRLDEPQGAVQADPKRVHSGQAEQGQLQGRRVVI